MFYPMRPHLLSAAFAIIFVLCMAVLLIMSDIKQSDASSATATASRTPSQTYTPGGPSLTPTRTLVMSSTPSFPSVTPTLTYTPGGPSQTPTSSSTPTAAFTSYLALPYASVSPTELLDIFVPPGSGPFPLILYIHGGGWMSGTRHLDQSYVQMQVVSHGYALASLDYRLSGEAIFPAQIYDVKAAIRWLRAHAATYNFDPSRIGLWGYSAGGHLADLAGTSGGVSNLEDLTMGNAGVSSRVQAVVSWAGPTKLLAMDNEKLACDTYDFDAPDSPVTYLLGAQPQTHPTLANNASPISYVSNDDPPFLLQQGTLDCTVPPLQSQDLYEALTAAGVPVTLRWMPGGGHSSFTSDPTVTAQVIAFFDQVLKNLGNPSVTPSPSPTSTAAIPRTDTIGIFRSGTFYLRLHNSTGNADISVAFTVSGKPYPVVGDWAGQGFDTVGVFNQDNGQFSLRNTNTPGTPDEQFTLGNPNDMPLSGRWLANATNAGVGVFRPSNGLIYLKNTLTTGYADYTMVLGIPGDVGLAGDWNGKGYESPGVYRPSNSNFYLSNQDCNCSVYADIALTYGVGGDAPVIGDWIAQGHDGVGLFRQSNGYTYLRNTLTTGYADNAFTYGIAGDVPVAGHWQAVYPPKPGGSAPVNMLAPPTFAPTPAHGSLNNGLDD